MGPARMIAESLTPKPGIREQYLPMTHALQQTTRAILERRAVRLLGGIDRDYGDGGEAVGAADAGAST